MTILVDFQTQSNAASLSAALEQLLRAHHTRQKLDSLDAQVAQYYDGLTDKEATAEQEWGAFASSQFVASREAESR